MNYTNLKQIQSDLTEGKLLLLNLIEYYLHNIQNHQNLNAVIEVFQEESLQKAVEIQKKIDQKTAGKLAGLVLGIKDNILYKGHITSAASKMLVDFEATYTASALQRLIDEDAIVIGRLNCDEFAMGGSNEHSFYGSVKNPLDSSKVSGGSSGGSAAAVAANLCLAALGTDTGGSIRQPASFCGITGYKPSYGRISRWGLIAYASSFDQIGPLTHKVEDAALITQIMAGKDGYDASMYQAEAPNFSAHLNDLQDIKGKKIGFFKDYLDNEKLDPVIRVQFNIVLDQLKAKGAIVEPINFPYLNSLIPTYYVLTSAEASSNLSRYSGVHYGHRTDRKINNIEELYRFSRTEGFGEEVKRRVMCGTFVLSAGNYEAFYIKAQKIRQAIYQTTNNYFDDYDCILSPTTPGVAFGLGEKKNLDPVVMYLEDVFTVHANLAGLPAISIPMGISGHLPTGLQIMGRALEDQNVLNWAQYLQENIL